MLGLFKKKQREVPPFGKLKDSLIKDKYFIRTARWDWLDESMIHVFDNNAPRMITMDPWPQLIYLEATGQLTVREFVFDMASKYGRNQEIPNELDSTILEVIDSLQNDQLVELLDQQKELPYYLAKPIAEQNKEKAHQLMVKDGFIKE